MEACSCSCFSSLILARNQPGGVGSNSGAEDLLRYIEVEVELVVGDDSRGGEGDFDEMSLGFKSNIDSCRCC